MLDKIACCEPFTGPCYSSNSVNEQYFLHFLILIPNFLNRISFSFVYRSIPRQKVVIPQSASIASQTKKAVIGLIFYKCLFGIESLFESTIAKSPSFLKGFQSKAEIAQLGISNFEIGIGNFHLFLER
ncbi:unnamed protein product [Cuscuta campestris]|uniref:Uncharacterized protein n=1 Tax=Cuscuta campestris TaxID=132261 RepID=A0A484KDD8_9ASTE|nr:unnamed protein product [Cuscuta campestris]